MTTRPRTPDLRPLERDVQRAVVGLFRSVGGIVYATSQYRASRISPGIPDLFAFFRARGVALWFEVKRPSRTGFHPFRPQEWTPEPLRPEQETFRQHATACGWDYYWGGTREAEDALCAVGLAVRDGNVLRLTPHSLTRPA